MLRIRKLILPWAAPLLLVALAGCGAGPRIVKVRGTLTYKGVPVKHAYVDFTPEHGRPSWGQTDEEGRFTLNYDSKQDGAVVGKHKVSVRLRPTTAAEQEAVMKGKRPPQSREMAAFFDKYGVNSSKTEVTIDKSTTDLKLDLN
jgi:hypothetical protein